MRRGNEGPKNGSGGSNGDVAAAPVTPATPATIKKRAARKSSKKATAAPTEGIDAADIQDGLAVKDEHGNGHQDQILPSIESASELKERVNGATKAKSKPTPTPRKKSSKKESQAAAATASNGAARHSPLKSTEVAVKQAETDAAEPAARATSQLNHAAAAGVTDQAEPSVAAPASASEKPHSQPSSSQKENVKPPSFQAGPTESSKPSDPDDMPFSLAEMPGPSREETERLLAQARQMVVLDADVPPVLDSSVPRAEVETPASQSDEASVSPRRAEDSHPHAEASRDGGDADPDAKKKRKAADLEADDAAVDERKTQDGEQLEGSDTKDDESDETQRPTKRTRLDLAHAVKKERRRHRAVVGLVAVASIA
ncbi:hypothetical protein KEM52_005743 [Ascosphaera acerosa]|nr:hypothetical protein KEM52_005743 [Ascosphaera acerosa]